ncbi:hypothetical protein PHYSODRAFT_246949 [Phytophthora sojae]|uniref:Uncharacterized protein n=1 Tax=Phytophthora sojae (strain P6497) TaxID=1094619 RepID=G4Z8S6_PHYSP|nr:hypothetical protein PHYSODRAFT_246949 [Phytophthora sojae]EGZ19108.1 hypothetical protein PHYSODRAFT_246949 [Phytophthora sojae]|eukprot:XP_009521825.1 hypothetical protein PHYSODRAFT_246949 [Phytophthora sojae]
MTQGDPREQQDLASEGFHSAGSAGGDQAATIPTPMGAAPGGQPSVTVPATMAAPAAMTVPTGTVAQAATTATTATTAASASTVPSAATTNPARPTLPDVTTPEGLAAARDLLQRALDITSRHAGRTSGQSWATTRPNPAAQATATRVPTTHPSAPAWTAAPSTASVVPQAQPSVPAWNAALPASGVVPPTQSSAAGWAYTPSTANVVPTLTPSTTSVPTSASVTTPRLRSTIAAYDGVSLEGIPAAAGYGFGVSPVGMRFTPMSQGATGPIASTYYGGMPSHIKYAVRMIQPFHSDHATVDKAKLFWDSFARATTELEEQLRIIHLLQLIVRLKTTKRSRGMSAEVWGDLVKSLCDEAQCFDPTMRYQYFLSGLRNREWKAALSSAMASTIQQAVLILLQRGMHIPVEDDADFADEKSSEKKSEDSAVKEMMEMLRQNQSLIMQQQAELERATRSPRRPSYAAVAYKTQPVVPPPMPPTLPIVDPSTVAGNDSPAGTASSKGMLPRRAWPRLETKATMVVGKDSPVVKVAVQACVRASGVQMAAQTQAVAPAQGTQPTQQ